jgi:hypothetical protein
VLEPEAERAIVDGTASKLEVLGRIELSNEAKAWNPVVHGVGPERGDWSHPQL